MKKTIIIIIIIIIIILANRPDEIIKNKTDKICLFIDVAIPLDRNVIQKKLKYKTLSTGCGRETGDYKNNNSNTVFTK
jgi:hypothetical protein